MPGRPWTEYELERARAMRSSGRLYGDIDRVLRRRAGTTKRRLEGANYNVGHNVRSMTIPDNVLAERDALAAARHERELTQRFFGDPPPGYSATWQDRATVIAASDPCASVAPAIEVGGPTSYLQYRYEALGGRIVLWAHTKRDGRPGTI
jgi:hypothetical protein